MHWHYIRDKALETLKRQAEREGGHILILPSDNSKEAGGLSSRTLDLSSIGKGSDLFGNEQGSGKKSSSDGKIDDAEGQRVLDAAKRAEELLNERGKRKSVPEIAVPGEESPFKATVISGTDGAKILQNLETFIGLVRNIDLSGKKNFLKVVKVAM